MGSNGQNPFVVFPAQAGIHLDLDSAAHLKIKGNLDPGLRWDDGKKPARSPYLQAFRLPIPAWRSPQPVPAN